MNRKLENMQEEAILQAPAKNMLARKKNNRKKSI
jgi:hypothetical protein